MRTLLELLLQDDYSTFFDTYFGRLPFAKPAAAKNCEFKFSFKEVAEILPHHKNSWLVKAGILDPSSTGSLTYLEFQEGFHVGQSLVIRRAQDSYYLMNRISQDFTQAFNCPIDIQLYATPAGQAGFGWHFDDEDVFIFQTEGCKEFYLRENLYKTLRQSQIPKTFDLNHYSRGPELRCTLVAGDFLYIPAKYWHRAEAHQDSFHISAGVLRESVLRTAPFEAQLSL